jgi:hypothetical protein
LCNRWRKVRRTSKYTVSLAARIRQRDSTEKKSSFADTWLLEPVPLPESFSGPGFLHLPQTLRRIRAAMYAIFVRYLFDLRCDPKLPSGFLVD